jgi:hypothetical protein
MNPQEAQAYQDAIANALGNLMLQNIAAGITAQSLHSQIDELSKNVSHSTDDT